MPAILNGKTRILAYAAVVLLIAALIAVLLLTNQNRPVAAGQNVVITVTADTLEDAYGYQFQMHYDEDALEYTGDITSKLEDIQTIFSKPYSGYELVGATMIGEQDGVSDRNQAVCELVFTAKEDTTLNDLDVSLSGINVVKSDLDYVEGIEDWSLHAALMK